MHGSSADEAASAGGYRPAHGPDWPDRLVWAVWAGATLVALLATAVHGRWLPWSDDFDVVPYVTGNSPVTAAWLWEQHNEHRIPLVKLLFVGLGRLSGADYRWTLAANALLLSATAAALILAARRLRGATFWTDALFPATLLHLGQGGLMWAFHSAFLLTTVLSGLFVALAIAIPRACPWRAAALTACAILMPLTGASGLIAAVAATTLLGAEAIWPPAEPRSRATRWTALVGAALTVALVGGYLIDLRLMPALGYAGPARTLAAALDVMASSPGGLVSRLRTPWLVATALAVVGTVAAAVPALRQSATAGRGRVAILLGYLACLGLVALAVGYGRGTRDFVAEGLHGHYSTLALGVPLALGLVWAALPQTRLALTAQALLCVVAVGVFLIHAKRSSRHWGPSDESWALIASDMRGPMPPEEVAARHAAPGLYFTDTPEVRTKIAAGVGMLRRSRFPLYCTRAPTPEPATP